jgi:hypothetical protein
MPDNRQIVQMPDRALVDRVGKTGYQIVEESNKFDYKTHFMFSEKNNENRIKYNHLLKDYQKQKHLNDSLQEFLAFNELKNNNLRKDIVIYRFTFIGLVIVLLVFISFSLIRKD